MTIVIFLGMGFSLIKDGSIMFNPGKLTAQSSTGQTLGGFRSHAELEKECRHCHAPLETNQADLCVRCHKNIMEQVVDKKGTHAKVENLSECRACHPDHQGRDFDTTAAAFDLFDHERTNFSLNWHQVDYDVSPIVCTECHQRTNGFKLKPEACMDCHSSYDSEFMAQHVQSLGDACLVCHDGSGDIANFDHSQTQFPLEGEHLQIQCIDCHTDGQFEELASECNACHSEPEIHLGFFSMNCETCHIPINWSTLVGLNGREFDHFVETQFSLERHLTNYAGQPMQCAECHASPDGIKVSFENQYCVNCHQTDDVTFMHEHQTQFGMECIACHDGVDRMHDFDHARFFLLDGAHIEVECVTCHVDQVFTGTPSDCSACHSEPEIHAGIFGLQCKSCHGTSSWSPAKMVEHAFPLDHGEQGMLACETCHIERYTEYTCYGCHDHQPDEILSEHLEEGITQPELDDCMACHPDGRELDD